MRSARSAVFTRSGEGYFLWQAERPVERTNPGPVLFSCRRDSKTTQTMQTAHFQIGNCLWDAQVGEIGLSKAGLHRGASR